MPTSSIVVIAPSAETGLVELRSRKGDKIIQNLQAKMSTLFVIKKP